MRRHRSIWLSIQRSGGAGRNPRMPPPSRGRGLRARSSHSQPWLHIPNILHRQYKLYLHSIRSLISRIRIPRQARHRERIILKVQHNTPSTVEYLSNQRTTRNLTDHHNYRMLNLTPVSRRFALPHLRRPSLEMRGHSKSSGISWIAWWLSRSLTSGTGQARVRQN